jgi:hypothetical protein
MCGGMVRYFKTYKVTAVLFGNYSARIPQLKECSFLCLPMVVAQISFCSFQSLNYLTESGPTFTLNLLCSWVASFVNNVLLLTSD